MSEVAVQDNNGDAAAAVVETTQPQSKKSKNLEPVFEEIEFDDAFDLTDEESWVNISSIIKYYYRLECEKTDHLTSHALCCRALYRQLI